MAGRGKSTQQSRTEVERARLHTARKTWHEGQIRRRTRDNTIAVVAGVLIVAGAVVSQVVHAQVNPPAPSPSPTVEPTEAPVPTDPATPEPAPTEAPAG
ncbi:hypothetical protein BMW26_08725 [Microbacterium sp. 1.5R]|uniref:hypothetical protein n=1 Tax=Microbacterium TaxID=33882 RepID=UPI00069DD978|nr:MULTISPECIES: hypothetical protein [unclassified Microbacterium]AKV85613.1 hypothetical protein AKG07_04125 [Microbacterium sp. CGR1]APH45032.1 hypothetical protein BMW26_08725 [Microbacterium sp. 1.5R]MBC6494711.1 hypothetical protein [Microbacterium sp. 4-7]